MTGNQASAVAQFEYGTSTAYGSTTSAQTITGVVTPQAITAPLTGLKAKTTYHFRLVATSPDGTTDGPDHTFTTRAVPPKPPPSAKAPSLTKLKLTPRKSSLARFKHATISYTDSEAATTTFVVSRARLGVQVGKRCLAPSKARHGRRCTILRRVGRFTHTDKAGATKFAVGGRIKAKRLGPGSYRLAATPKQGKLAGATLTISFTLTP